MTDRYFVDGAGRWRESSTGRYASEAAVLRWLDRGAKRRRTRGGRVRPPIIPPPPPPLPPPPSEETAVEWEFGAEYDGTGVRHGVFPVDINLRVWRNDRAPMPLREARRVLSAFVDHLAHTGGRMERHALVGYQVAAINWRSPGRGGWRPRGGHGGASDVRMFANVLYMLTDVTAWRIGAVDHDEPGW